MKPAIVALLLVLSLTACGDNSTPAPEAEKEAAAGTSDGTTIAEKSAPAASARTPSPAGAKVSIVEPQDGATVKSPVTVKFAVEGMDLVPAGTDKPNSGHHHLLIDAKLENPDAPIPANATHIHLGKAQTETEVQLTPGPHTLQDVFADKSHIPHDPVVESPVINITVE